MPRSAVPRPAGSSRMLELLGCKANRDRAWGSQPVVFSL